MDSPLHITLYDKDFVRTAWIDDPDRLKVNPRHLLIPTADFDVPIDYRFLPELTDPGARITIEDDFGEQIFSGPIRPWDGTGPTTEGTLTFTAEDDARILWNMLGYPTPGSAIGSQTVKEDVRTGDAETVLKGYISANVARWGRPITVATNLNRGNTITAAIRMVPLSDILLPLLETSGIGFQVRQVGAGLVFDVYAQQLFPLNLTEDGGVVQGYSVSYRPMTATRAVIAGPNTGTSREFNLYIDAAREAAGDTIEILVDAADEPISLKQIAKGQAAVGEAGPKYGVTMTLDDTSVFTYGGPGGIRRGDQVSVELGPGIPLIVDVVREPELSFTRDSGYTATFAIGDTDSQPDEMIASQLDQLGRGIRELRTR